MNEKTDEQLVRSYIKGDEPAMEELVRRYLGGIYSFAARYTGNPDNAADIAQETFVKLWKNINRFDQKASFRPWIFKIAKNTALDWLRKRADVPFSAFEDSETGESKLDIGVSGDLDNIIDIKAGAARAKILLGKLPEKYQSVIRMHDEEELTFKEIAGIFREPLNTVKSRYRRAILALRNRLGHSPEF